MTRKIIFDLETTGFNFKGSDRVVEFCFLEVVENVPTGLQVKGYVNPQKKLSKEIIRLLGIDDDFLQDKPPFSFYADEILDFIQDSPLIAHNAKFDMGFMNRELGLCGKNTVNRDRFIDSICLAKKIFPGQGVSLDALLKRYSIPFDNMRRHSAISDAHFLAQVYFRLQQDLVRNKNFLLGQSTNSIDIGNREPCKSLVLSLEERKKHGDFLSLLGGKCLWKGKN